MSSTPSEPNAGVDPPFNHTSSVAPLNVMPRIQSLDVLRGIALIGGMFISIWIFGGFSVNQQNGLLLQSKGLNHMLFVVVNFLLEGKMRALISIVFGAGMVLYLFKGNQMSQLYNADFFIRRQMWLIAFGLINALVFLWQGDILFHLGIMGVLLFAFVRLPAKGLLIAAVITTLIYSGKNYWRYADDKKVYNKYLAVVAVEKKITADSIKKAKAKFAIKNISTDTLNKKQKKDTLTKKQKGEKAAWEGLIKNLKYDPKKDDDKNETMRSTSYGKIWNHQLGDTQWIEAGWTYRFGIWELGSMIFLGMALFRFGFFDPGRSSRIYLVLTLTGLIAGLLLAWFRLHNHHLALQDYTKYIARQSVPYHLLYPFEVAFMAIGYASLVLLLINVGFLKHVWNGFAIVGRMALTNYLIQSIICLFFFTGFGMGYYARLQQWQLYVFAGEIALVNIAFSMFWLRHYQYGPAEWLLRWMVYKTRLPNKISKPDLTDPVTL